MKPGQTSFLKAFFPAKCHCGPAGILVVDLSGENAVTSAHFQRRHIKKHARAEEKLWQVGQIAALPATASWTPLTYNGLPYFLYYQTRSYILRSPRKRAKPSINLWKILLGLIFESYAKKKRYKSQLYYVMLDILKQKWASLLYVTLKTDFFCSECIFILYLMCAAFCSMRYLHIGIHLGRRRKMCSTIKNTQQSANRQGSPRIFRTISSWGVEDSRGIMRLQFPGYIRTLNILRRIKMKKMGQGRRIGKLIKRRWKRKIMERLRCSILLKYSV